jgi:hypothetical protein
MVPQLIGPRNIRWRTLDEGVLLSEPGLGTHGYEMSVLFLARGKTYQTEAGLPVIVNMLRGRVTTFDAQMQRGLYASPCKQYDVASYRNSINIRAEDDALVFLCSDRGSPHTFAPTGLDAQWIQPAPDCYRTDPKIEVDDIRINLWYLTPNKNGGIHNHAENQGHNIGDRNAQFVEWHTQLRGNGWMVKYHSQDEGSEYERIAMKIGQAHPLFSTVRDGVVSYPLHAYVTGHLGALFIAFEDLRIS